MSTGADLLEVRGLVDRYCSAVGDRDAERLGALFVPGGRLVVYVPGRADPVGELAAPEGFARLVAALREAYERTFHFVGNHYADVDAAAASGETYCVAFHLRQTEAGREEETALVRYRDRFARTEKGWRFERRDAYRQWTDVRPLHARRHAVDRVMAEMARRLG